ncbi:MAG: hypothetical protein BGP06_19215 [Rhizobiales bacterium 65-9]|nr:MAG: hypothetical protein BGP06_19215 [Rhizobiales bacterium 65-9]
MGDVINLRRARKESERRKDERRAEENRVRFGRTKQQRDADAQSEAARLSRLDAHRREPSPADE